MPAGKRPKLEGQPEQYKTFMDAIALGVPIVDACASIYLDESVYYDYIKKGNDPKTKNEFYAKFTKDVKKAQSKFVTDNVYVIRKAAIGHDTRTTKTVTGKNGITETTVTEKREYSWQAAAWLLERSHPDKFGRRFDIDGNEQAEVRIIVTPVAGPGHTPKPNGGTKENGTGKGKKGKGDGSNGKAKGNGKKEE